MNNVSKTKHSIISQDKYLEFLSADLLRQLGINYPTKKQLKLVSLILSTVSVTQSLSFDNRLTDREICCLYWTSMGKTSSQTAKILNVQRYTVEEYRKEIKRKLECKSMAEAIFKGLRFGYLQQKID